MSWKAVLAGRENDPSFLLKSLVEDIEKAMERQPRPSPYPAGMGEGKNIEGGINDINDFANRALYLYFKGRPKAKDGYGRPKDKPKLSPEDSRKLRIQVKEGIKKDIENYYEELKKKVSSEKIDWKELKEEWLIDNFYFSVPKGEKRTINRKFFDDKTAELPKKLKPENLDPLSQPIRQNIIRVLIVGDRELQPEYKKAKEVLAERKKELKQWEDREKGIRDSDLEDYKNTLSRKKSNVMLATQDVKWLEGQIAEVKSKQFSKKQLFAQYGGEAKFKKIIKDSKKAFIDKMKEQEIKVIDDAIEKIQNEVVRWVTSSERDNITFMEIYSDLEGKSELKQLKKLLQDEEMKSFFNSLEKVRYELPKKWKKMTPKEKNDWKLQNKRKFQDSYQRILKNLKALKNKYSKMESNTTIKRKIDNITSVINTLVKRFDMKNWSKSDREAEETKRERGTSFRRTSDRLTDAQRKESEKFELTALYEVLFSDPELLDKGNIKSKFKSFLSSGDVDVSAPTKKLWKDFTSKLEVFTKSQNPEKDFVKFIASNELYLIDVVNLLQTKRNKTKIPAKKLVLQKPKKEKKEEIARLPPSKRRKEKDPFKKSYVPREHGRMGELASLGQGTGYVPRAHGAKQEVTIAGKKESKPIGSNTKAMEERMKKLGRQYKQKMRTDFKKLKEKMNTINTDDFDKYFSEAKSVMDSDLFAWIDKTNKGIGLRPFAYDSEDKGFSEIEESSKKIMKLLNSKMQYEGEEIKVLNLINKLARKVYKKQAGAIVSAKRKRISEGLKEIKESTIRNIQNQKKVDFEIPRLLKLKFKQEGIKLKKYFYNIFEATDTKDGFEIDLPEFNSGKANNFIRISENLSNELTEIEKKLFDKWKEISEKLTEESKEEDEAKEKRTVGQRVGALYIATRELNKIEDNIYEYDELIDKTMRQIGILEVEIEAFIELFEKAQKKGFISVATKRTLPDKEQKALAAKYNEKIQDAKRSMKRKLKLIPNFKKAIKKLDKLGEGWKKSLENIKESTRGKEE